MFGRTITVLMWKHGVVRLRKYIYTTLEALSPLLLFICLFVFKDTINPKSVSSQYESTITNTEVLDLVKDTTGPDINIFFNPNTTLSTRLLEQVGQIIGLKPRNNLRSEYAGGNHSYSLDERLKHFINVMRDGDAIVIFENFDGDKLPDKLNYTIRMKQDFQTHGYLPSDQGPHAMFGLSYLKFMRLQWAIDASYIKLRSNKSMDRTVYLQEFPSYRTRNANIITLITSLVKVSCYLSFLMPFVFLMSRLLEERTSGIQELVKMVGVPLNILGLSHFLNVLPIMLLITITVTWLLTQTSNPLLCNTSPILLFLFFLLYVNTIISMAFVCSYILTRSEYGVTVSVIMYGLLWLPSRLVELTYNVSMPSQLTYIFGLFPHMPMCWFWENVAGGELMDIEVGFSHIFYNFGGQFECSMFKCLIYLVLQAVLFYGLTWYLSLVRPGQYGQPLPWNFLFKKQYWTRKNEVEPDLESDALELMQRDEQYFEKTPDNLKPGIRIEGVSKAYGNNMVLKDVSLKVYQGEITVLLGHNGAGKTTLISIITGMTNATKGQVYVDDLDALTQQSEVRKRIGFCPQHNMFFPDLTLQQHIMFFTLLKKGTYAEARNSSRKLAAQLGLKDKLFAKCAKLSGGMKRRAQLACALAGDADVLVLDEPTSGLDVETRRELWDLLLSLRGNRTVLLTTHFMEEADALGDRVAALHAGHLRCHATTIHLKRAVGEGYRLSLTTIGLPKDNAITELVLSHVPDATVKEKTVTSIVYALPSAANDKFPELFTDLESKRSELSIDSIGVGISTLEEVFLKLCSNVDTTVHEETKTVEPEVTYRRHTGFALLYRQFAVLFKRQIKYASNKKWLFIILQIILPVLLVIAITLVSNNSKMDSLRDFPLRMDLDIYSDMPERRVLYSYNMMDKNLRSRTLQNLKEQNPGVTFEEADDIAERVIDVGRGNLDEYKKYLVGIEQINDTSFKVLYTTAVRHAAPVGLNLLTNMLAKNLLDPSTTEIRTYNEPIESAARQLTDFRTTKTTQLLLFYALCITFFLQATNLHSASLPCRERETGSRHIHIMSGCSPELYWFTTLAFHTTLVILFLITPIVMTAAILDKDNTINQGDFLGSFALLQLMGSLTMFSLIYLLSFYCNERYTNVILVAFLFVFGLVFPLLRQAYEVMEYETSEKFNTFTKRFVDFSWNFMPPHTITTTAVWMTTTARLNAICHEARSECPGLGIVEMNWDATTEDRCCRGLKPKHYFEAELNTPLHGLIILLLQFIFFMVMIMLMQRGIFDCLYDKLMNRYYKAKELTKVDPLVKAEKVYVQHEITKPVNDIKNDAILVSDVHKNYPSIFNSCNAVKGIDFSVKKGECFGLLGVNGAGKSTTFKMLTAELSLTKGKIFGNGHRLEHSNSKYLRSLGYCPQFFGLDMFLSGKDNLKLLLTLRGCSKEQVDSEVKNWIEIVGLEKHAMRPASTYSGGCLRRLGAASALCGQAGTVLLDEPSAGVDVAARRRLWAALRRALAQRRSIIISSHSMDEMESLCSRIAIMSAGRVRALGSPRTLRAQHAAGHAVVLRVKHAAGDEVDGAKSQINMLKGRLKETFNCSLKDEHESVLHYHINEIMRYSELFTRLEALKQDFPNLIEDYCVTETTLEEVFLSLANEAKEDQKHTA